jgi:hypothetical protein
MKKFINLTLYLILLKDDLMKDETARMGKSKHAYTILVGKSHGKRNFRRCRQMFQDNIKMINVRWDSCVRKVTGWRLDDRGEFTSSGTHSASRRVGTVTAYPGQNSKSTLHFHLEPRNRVLHDVMLKSISVPLFITHTL